MLTRMIPLASSAMDAFSCAFSRVERSPSQSKQASKPDTQVYHIRPFYRAEKPSRYADLRGLFVWFRGLVRGGFALARKGPLAGAGEVDERARQGASGHCDRGPRVHEGGVEDDQRISRVIERKAQRHRGHVARPLTKQGVPTAIGKGVAAVEQPRRGG